MKLRSLKQNLKSLMIDLGHCSGSLVKDHEIEIWLEAMYWDTHQNERAGFDVDLGYSHDNREFNVSLPFL